MSPQGYQQLIPHRVYNNQTQVLPPYRQQGQPYQNMNAYSQVPGPIGMYATKSRLLFILSGILFGQFGVHWFYLGNTSEGILYLLISLLTLAFAAIMMSIPAIIDICTTTKDMYGNHLV